MPIRPPLAFPKSGFPTYSRSSIATGSGTTHRWCALTVVDFPIACAVLAWTLTRSRD